MPPDTATEVRDQSKEAASQAAEEIAKTAREQAGAVAREAVSGSQQVAAEARTEAARVVDEAKQQVKGQAEAQAVKIAESLERLQDQARSLLAGDYEEARPLVGYAEEAVAGLGKLSSHLRSRGFDGLVEDTQRFARRRPGVFLAGAAVAGFLAGRLIRSAQDDEQGSTVSANAQPFLPEERPDQLLDAQREPVDVHREAPS